MITRLLGLYRALKAPARASLWFLICGFLHKGVSLLTTPLFTRIMTSQEYGRFSVYNSWLGIIQIIVSLNLAAGVYTRGLVKNETDQDRFTSSMLGLSSTCIILWTVIYMIFHDLVNSWLDMSTVLMSAMLVEIWATVAYQFWSNKERVNYRYGKLVALTITYTILRPLLALFSVLSVDTALQVEARVISTTAVNVVLFTGLYGIMMRKGKHYFDKEYWIYALKFNIPLIPHYLSQIVLSQADRIMIGRICSSNEVAFYSVAYTLSMVLQILNSSISGTMNPWIYKSLQHDHAERIGKPSYYILLLIAVCNLGVIVLAPEILAVLAPGSYQEAIWVIPPVTVSVYFMFLYNLFATFEYYYEKTHYVMLASITGAVLNVVLNAVFIPRFGFVAAGYTTLFCYVVYSFTHYCFMRKVIKENLGKQRIYDPKLIVGLGVLLVVFSFGAMSLYEYVVMRYLLLFVGIAVIVIKRKKLLRFLRVIQQKQI